MDTVRVALVHVRGECEQLPVQVHELRQKVLQRRHTRLFALPRAAQTARERVILGLVMLCHQCAHADCVLREEQRQILEPAGEGIQGKNGAAVVVHGDTLGIAVSREHRKLQREKKMNEWMNVKK